MCYQFCDNWKSRHAPTIWKKLSWKSLCLPILMSMTEIIRLGLVAWSLFILNASYLVKWPITTWSFMWWCQFIDWLKFETRPVSCWISERPSATWWFHYWLEVHWMITLSFDWIKKYRNWKVLELSFIEIPGLFPWLCLSTGTFNHTCSF